MYIPEDWDKPGPDNPDLVAKFDKYMHTYKGVGLPIRFFCPDATGRLPLVLFLHGADCLGDDNENQLSMHDIGTMFARDEWQRINPCYVIAPQFSHSQLWSSELSDEAILDYVEMFVREHNIDTDRIYVYGYSAGAVRTLRLVKDHPDRFAGAIAICGAISSSDPENILRTPLWLVHAEDDLIVKASYKEHSTITTHLGSSDLYELFSARTDHLHYTHIPAGEMKQKYHVNPHCSWVMVSGEDGKNIRDWLFACRRDEAAE